MTGHVVYQIYPRSFMDSNGDGIGDLRGIISRLDYLNDGTETSLGINMIWLSPFYPSPMADFGYDISDYCNVAAEFGTLDDFKELVREAHKRGIKLMIDLVPNHTSDHHAWFTESRTSRDNPKRDWYVWRDAGPDGSPPNNWLSVFGGSAWSWDETTGQYYLHSFLKEQPDLNWENPRVRDAVKDVMRFWLDMGVGGIRVDAVDWMAKDVKFRDNPPNPKYSPGVDDPYHQFNRTHSQDGPQLFGYVREMAEVVKAYPYGFMVTETYPDRRNVVSEYLRLYDNYLAEVAAPFNFEGILLPWRATAFKAFVDKFQAELSDKRHYVPIYVMGNHDNSRLATRIGPAAARTAAMLLLTLPGVTFIYYGDELGMTDRPIPPELVQDPFEKRVPGMGLGRDPERTPMQWNRSAHAGFSKAGTWLPVNDNYKQVNVASERLEPRSSLRLYQELIYLRNHSHTIMVGEYHSIILDNPLIFGYMREYEGRRILVLLNFTDQVQEFDTGFEKGKLMITTKLDRSGEAVKLNHVTLEPNEGWVVRLPFSLDGS
ncbi:MAG: alpha-amylase family glycosyl hydrolase [Candidatus Saccharimonadales bacterium]